MNTKILSTALIGALLALLAASPSAAWDLSCEALCGAATAKQSYGTGADDLACLNACLTGEECWNAKGPKLWEEYFDCVDSGATLDQCWPEYVDAKECAVCDQGQVAPWKPADVVFVNEPGCNPNGPQTGTFDKPYCKFNDGLDIAITRQENAQTTKVAVCQGTYREGYDGIDGRTINPAGLAPVVVEAVTRDSAVISGSEDWTGVWLPETVTINEDYHNELKRSWQLNHSEWWKVRTTVAPQFVLDPPTFAVTGSTVKVFRIEADNDYGGTLFVGMQQQIPSLANKLATYSIYIRPDQATRFRIDFLLEVNGAQKSGAYHVVELPPAGQCCTDTSSGTEAYGVEDAGNDWYRVWFTQRVDTKPNESPSSVEWVRFQIFDPLDKGDGAQIFAPQLDHRPLENFATEPRPFLTTGNNTAHATLTRTETFYVNDSSQKSWTHDWGLARHSAYWPDLLPLARRAEMVFLEDQLLRQELAVVDMKPGSFLVEDGVSMGGYNHKDNARWVSGKCDERAPCPIRILPPAGVDMEQVKIEVAVQPRLLWLTTVLDWQVRGLHFTHSTGAYDIAQQGDCLGDESSADCRFPMLNSAVALINTRDLTVLENRLDWNNSYGLGVGGITPFPNNNVQLLRNRVNDNGFGGESLHSARGFVVDGEEFSRNNWRGQRTGVLGNATTGAKYSGLAEGTIANIVVEDNYGNGLWFDWENQAVEVTDCLISRNHGAGLYFEANDHWPAMSPPVLDPTTTVERCLIQDNLTGLQAISSSDVEFEWNVLLGNQQAITMIGNPRPATGHDKLLRDWTLRHNKLLATCPQQGWFHYGEAAIYNEWQAVMESMDSDRNDYSHPLGIGFEGFVINTDKASLPTWSTCTLAAFPWCYLTQDGGSMFVP